MVWTLQHPSVQINDFTAEDLVNFLEYMVRTRKYKLSTLKLWRSAVSRFHRNPGQLHSSVCLSTFFYTVASKAPPQNIHRPTVNLTPTLQFVASIPSVVSTNLAPLQSKLALLLGLSAFLRPSDLHRIDLNSAVVSADNTSLYFEVFAPKERRQGVRIIKPFSIRSHQDPRLCPVLCFIAVRDHPRAISSRPQGVLFVNSNQPSKSVKITTISSWLRRLLHRSTKEQRVSVRSIGSSIALRAGINVDDIVTLGNWRTSETFHQHYRREHMSTVDFTNSVLAFQAPSVAVDSSIWPNGPGEEDDEDSDDEYFDCFATISDVSSGSA